MDLSELTEAGYKFTGVEFGSLRTEVQSSSRTGTKFGVPVIITLNEHRSGSQLRG